MLDRKQIRWKGSKQGVKQASMLIASSCLLLGSAIPAMATPTLRTASQQAPETVAFSMSSSSLLLEEALSITETIEDPRQKSMTLASVAVVYAEQGDLNRAKSLLAEAVQIAEQSDEPASSSVWNRIATGYFTVGETAQAVELLSRSLGALGTIRRQSPNYSDFIETITLYGEFGETFDDAELVQTGLEQATQIAAKIESSFRERYAYGKIAIAYGHLNNPDIAEAGIAAMTERIQAPARTTAEFALTDVAEAWARQGDTQTAIALLDQIIQPDSTYLMDRAIDVYLLLEDTVAARTALDKLAVTVQRLEASADRVKAINEIAIAYINIGEPQAAEQLLPKALPLTPQLAQPGDGGVFLLSQLAQTYARLGNKATQQDLLQQTFDLFAPADLPEYHQLGPWQAIAFQTMSHNYAQLSDDTAAEKLAVLQQVAAKGNWDRTYAIYLGYLAAAANQRGDTELVMQLLDKAVAIVELYDYAQEPARNWNTLGTTVQGLEILAFTYGQMLDAPAAMQGLQKLNQIADQLADSSLKQDLLSEIALSYAAQSYISHLR